MLRWLHEVRWLAVGLVLATLLVYAPTFNFDFLNWDDVWYIHRNELIRSWHPANLYAIMTQPVARNFAPLTIGTFLVEHSLWQLWPGGYHVTNVLIHMVNALLVLQLLRQLTRNDWLAWMVAVLFVVHPVQVESVAWISSRKTLLSATFLLASCICWFKPQRSGRDEAWGIGWLILSLLCKAAGVVLPVIVVAYDVLVAKKKISESIARQVVPLFCCVMLILTTMNAQVTVIGGLRNHIGMSKWRILAIDLTLLWRYVGILVFPHDLCVLYDPPVEGIALMIVLAAVAWGAVGWMLWRLRKTHPLVTFAGICWLLLFLPVLNLFPLTTLMNDRYLYLPCIPFFALALGGVQTIWRWTVERVPRLTTGQNLLAAGTSALVIGLSTAGTLNYLPVWKEPLALWSYARQQLPDEPLVQKQWALTLRDLGRTDEAREVLLKTLPLVETDEPQKKSIEAILQGLDENRDGA
ncbi:hypothetical protein SH661x_003667 [Planctomicrobium sp. SH661]|uniref:hypothetical protein n=1 Tax=Planctomicrobium sp. SH661 TaxID=3448124 RepID=UPI003F5C466C